MVLPQLRNLLMAGSDPALRCLRPPSQPDDPEAEATFRVMVDDDLLHGRLEAIETVEDGIDRTTLDDEGVAAWMHSINSLRLVLGERLDVAGFDLTSHDPAQADEMDAPLIALLRGRGNTRLPPRVTLRPMTGRAHCSQPMCWPGCNRRSQRLGRRWSRITAQKPKRRCWCGCATRSTSTARSTCCGTALS